MSLHPSLLEYFDFNRSTYRLYRNEIFFKVCFAEIALWKSDVTHGSSFRRNYLRSHCRGHMSVWNRYTCR